MKGQSQFPFVDARRVHGNAILRPGDFRFGTLSKPVIAGGVSFRMSHAEENSMTKPSDVRPRCALGGGWEEPAEIVRIGDDPHGRNERTVFYRQPKTHGAQIFYLWEKLWPAHWTALPNAEISNAPTSGGR